MAIAVMTYNVAISAPGERLTDLICTANTCATSTCCHPEPAAARIGQAMFARPLLFLHHTQIGDDLGDASLLGVEERLELVSREKQIGPIVALDGRLPRLGLHRLGD